MKLALITIGQAPRADAAEDLSAILPAGADVLEKGALDTLDAADIAALAPHSGESALTSRLRDGSSAIFSHDQAVPLIEEAISRGEADGADASLLLCSGSFPGAVHTKPLFLTEQLSHEGVRTLLSGLGSSRYGVVRPLPEQVVGAYDEWMTTSGLRPSAVTSASPYTASIEQIGEAAQRAAEGNGLVVLDCIGFSEAMRRDVATRTGGIPVVTVRGIALHSVAAML